ncbi:hypothetical protein [Haloplanus aerogenes]|uniref:Uncharacterized protein n=1 Tax=Haloplanus aerogenes TaxID=660522 RepID=A0A3M0DR16_9EURY|nr:hypothetical protein [Haloplanus aerogenes]AZH24268.1 hypothetical protein DU502_02270 [Haloplanus aerogenes]RMB24101.1 hypothetical protein ATH50_1339 [Haloplanus aerogenes]
MDAEPLSRLTPERPLVRGLTALALFATGVVATLLVLRRGTTSVLAPVLGAAVGTPVTPLLLLVSQLTAALVVGGVLAVATVRVL